MTGKSELTTFENQGPKKVRKLRHYFLGSFFSIRIRINGDDDDDDDKDDGTLKGEKNKIQEHNFFGGPSLNEICVAQSTEYFNQMRSWCTCMRVCRSRLRQIVI